MNIDRDQQGTAAAAAEEEEDAVIAPVAVAAAQVRPEALAEEEEEEAAWASNGSNHQFRAAMEQMNDQELGDNSEDEDNDNDDDDEEEHEAAVSSPRRDQFRAVEDLTRILSQNDPERMKLTREEHQWALRIKENIETNVPELDNLTDFMYAQLALVCKNDDMEDVLRRCHGLQGFQQEYKVILDSVNEGCKSLQKLFNIFPELFLSMSFSPNDGTYIILLDMSKFEPTKNFTSPKLVEEWMRSMWYLHESFNPDFESIRKGNIVVSEDQEVTLMNRDVLKHLSALYSQFVCYYPLNSRVRHYNSGVMMNVLLSILRQLLPEHMQDNYQVGLKFEGNLRQIFLAPTPEEASQRTLSMMQENLKRRYGNVEAFTL